MSDTTARRRYFVAEGATTDHVKADVLTKHKEHQERLKAFLATYGATLCMQTNGYPNAILLEDGSAVPDGFKVECKRHHEGKTYLQLKPVGNKKSGKEVLANMSAVGSFSASDIITKHFGCNRMVYSGGSMWVSTAWIHAKKDVLVVQVPESGEDVFVPHHEFREIKKSEYIAITEE